MNGFNSANVFCSTIQIMLSKLIENSLALFSHNMNYINDCYCTWGTWPIWWYHYPFYQAASTGFPDLQELSLAVNTDINVSNGGIAIDDNMLLRLLVKSHQLRLLDLRGCTHITAVGIQVRKVSWQGTTTNDGIFTKQYLAVGQTFQNSAIYASLVR